MGLEAAGADARADGHPDVLWPRTEEAAHFPHRLGGKIQSGPPPSGMDRADGAGYRVVEQEDDAVRREDHQVQPRLVRHQGVGGIIPGGKKALPTVRRRHMPHRILVDLLGPDHVPDIRPKGRAKTPVVLQNVLPIIRLRAVLLEIQGGKAPLADTSQAGGEAVDSLPVLQNRGGVVCDARGGLDEK